MGSGVENGGGGDGGGGEGRFVFIRLLSVAHRHGSAVRRAAGSHGEDQRRLQCPRGNDRKCGHSKLLRTVHAALQRYEGTLRPLFVHTPCDFIGPRQRVDVHSDDFLVAA